MALPRAANGFLRNLAAHSYAHLAGHLKLVDLEAAARLLRHGDAVDWVYFPRNCLLSSVSATSTGRCVGTSLSGNEGAVGLAEACGSGSSEVDWIVQVDGQAWRCPGIVCRDLSAADPAFNVTAWRFAELLLLESRQSTLCQSLHSVEQRFARGLLESSDRSGGRNPLPMTQEFFAALLAVQRTTISLFASALQSEKLISYQRGHLRIVNKIGLEARACECRHIAEQARMRLGFRTTHVSENKHVGA